MMSPDGLRFIGRGEPPGKTPTAARRIACNGWHGRLSWRATPNRHWR